MESLVNALDLLRRGGVVMIPLLGCSLISVAVMLERAVALRRADPDTAPLMARLRRHVEAGDLAAALEECRTTPGVIARVLESAMASLESRQQPLESGASPHEDGSGSHPGAPIPPALSLDGRLLVAPFNPFDTAALERRLEELALAETPELYRRLGWLDTIITISPLLGLLGTVLGMIGAFRILGATGAAHPTAITSGVAEALIATATGLAIAIVTLVGYNALSERVRGLLSMLELRATQLVNLLAAASERPIPRPDSTRSPGRTAPHAASTGTPPNPSPATDGETGAATIRGGAGRERGSPLPSMTDDETGDATRLTDASTVRGDDDARAADDDLHAAHEEPRDAEGGP